MRCAYPPYGYNNRKRPSMIDDTAVPSGAGSKEFARIPSAWLIAATEKQDEAVASSSSNKP